MAKLGLVVGLALLASSCGGGGGSGSGSSQSGQAPTPIPTVPGQPSPTPTPLEVVPSANQLTNSSQAGAITLRIQDIDILVGDMTAFSTFLVDSHGTPVSQQPVAITTGLVVLSPQTPGPNGNIIGVTGTDGSLSGSVLGAASGRYPLTVGVQDPASPLDGLSVTLTIVVHAGSTPTSGPPTATPTPVPTSTATTTPIPTPTLTPTATPTPEPCAVVQTIIVQTDTPNVSSQTGGSAKITAIAFDSNNIRVAGVAILFEVQPGNAASFSQLVQTTDDNGTAMTTLNIPVNSIVGSLAISAQACGKTGNVSVNVVAGVSTKPVATVVLQADPSTVGTLSGGAINLTAAVFDADNAPINAIDVLFVTPAGYVNPLTDQTQSGVATSVLQVPIGMPEGPFTVSAIAGSVSGSATITVVAGSGTVNPDVPPGEPAAITLGASPTHIQVAGTGGTELATVIGRVFDNNGNPLSGVTVHYQVVAAESAAGAAILPVTTPVPTSSPTPIPTTLCAADDPVSVSDVAGVAVIQVHAGPQPGPVTVAACADTTIDGVPSPISEQQTVVTISSGPASHVGISISQKFSNNNDGTLLTVLSASVTDAQGNPVEDGTGVFFAVLTNGPDDPAQNVVLSGSAVTDAEPACDTSQYVAQTGLPISLEPGNAIACVKYPMALQATEIQVHATVGSVDNQGGQAVTLPGAVSDLEVKVVPATVLVNNTDDAPALVRAAVFDANLDPVENVRIHFTTSVGTIDQSALTDSNGQASATLVIPAGTESGTATVQVEGGGLPITDVTVPIVNVTATTTPTPGTPTPVAQPGAMQFVGAQPATIGVLGSGLPEQSVLTFQVTDAVGNPLAGVTVNFSIARIADEQISPLQAVTDSAGNVQVTLTSGERAMSLQVTAEIDSVSPPLIVRSTAVSILGGPPSQPNFSVVHQLANVSGGVFYGTLDKITAFVADRFGNPVPPGTTVDFTTKGGAIGNPTTTSDLGQATATLVTQAPVPANGIVVTLATTSGERPFIDVNGNGVCDSGDQLLAIPEPFYDANCSGTYEPGDDFIDLNGNGVWDSDQGSGTPACGDQVVVFNNVCTTFSGPTSVWLIPDGTGPIEPGGSRDYTLIVSDNPNPIANPGVGNPIVGGSTVAVSVDGSRARVIGLSNFTMPDAMTFDQLIDGINRFRFTVLDNAPQSTTSEVDVVTINVTSDVNSLPGGGNGSATVSDVITFLAAPTPTPTITATFTPTATPTLPPSPTPTPQPPMIAPTQSTLAAGDGAPPNGCNGATQTFVVTGGSPPFNVFAGGGCVSVSSVPASGGSFIFTAGNVLGNFTITVTDAAGKTASAGVTVQGPPTPTFTQTQPPTTTPTFAPTFTPTVTPTPTPAAAYIQVALFVSQASNNNDGTLTTVISALVTDANNVTVANGIPVQFSIVPTSPTPVVPAGVAVTSPGYTGAAAPCTLGFTVVPQPGDALSCVKYNQALQGATVTIEAQVQTPSGPISDTETIVLPDLRTPTPTRTATNTPTTTITLTPTFTPTLTFTPTFTLTATPTYTVTPVPTNTPLPSATVPPTPGAAYVRLDQILSQVTNNQDGTFTTIVSALVTDASGVVVGNGVPVQFTLVNPVSGVSLTSPGYTGQAQPCTIDFSIVLQPGDALSCLKYVAALQGTTVTVQASVQTATGGFVTDQRQIILIDTRPTATPTITSTPTVLPTATPTVQPPSIAPSGATLWAGVEPPPNCNGVSQTFVVTGGAPPFTISDYGVGCLSTTVVSASGGSFTFTAGNEVAASLPITATDALGRIATAEVTQQGSPAAFIDVDLSANQRVDNGDGTYSSVVSALVTEADGTTVPDGVPVEFSLVNPVAGVSITSPGFTNEAQPCTISFTVTPQPGDALACIKYVYSLQGSTITIRASVMTANGTPISAETTITLPDTRPTPTPTVTATPPPTYTPTNTATPSPFPSGVATFTPAGTATATATPPAGSIQFLGATPSFIGVRGSGLPEQSTLVFEVNSTTNNPMSGVAVQFTLSGSGSESLNPTAAVSDQNGLVNTTVTSGTQATTVRVIATVETPPGISAQSTAVSILGAPPDYDHFSIAAAQLNIQGRVTFGLSDQISVYVNDRFGNAVPPGTAVSLVTNAASVVNPTTTDTSGVATATLLTEGVVPPSGIVTVMAYTHGEESFLDNNGNGVYDVGIDTILTPNVPEPFIDYRPLPPGDSCLPGDSCCSVPPPSSLCKDQFIPGTPFQLFVDTNGDGKWQCGSICGPAAQGQGTLGVWDNNILVWRAIPVTFSGPTQAPVLEGCQGQTSGTCSAFYLETGASMSFTIAVHDDLVNPLVGGSTIDISASNGTVTGGSITVPDGESFNQLVDGLTQFTFVLTAPTGLTSDEPAVISVTIASPNGNVTSLLTSGELGP
jgi:hypothetical protein